MDKRLVRYAHRMEMNHYYQCINYRYLYYKSEQRYNTNNYMRVKVYNTRTKTTYYNHIWKWEHVVEVDKDDIMVKML